MAGIALRVEVQRVDEIDDLHVPRQQILEVMPLKVGDVYAADKVKKSRDAVNDLYGKLGHPVRTTVSEMGPTLLGRILELNDVQSGILEIALIWVLNLATIVFGTPAGASTAHQLIAS